MPINTRRILLSCAALLIAACICLAAIAVSGAGISFLNRSAANPTPSLTLIPTTKPPAALAVTPGGPTTGLTLPATISQQMDQIQAQVESYRGLHATSPVTRGLLTSSQLRQKVIGDFLKDYTTADAEKDATVLHVFGFLPANFNFLTFQQAFLSEQIAGFYDPVTKEMFVITDEGFGGVERFSYSHEYTHVLQDQTYDLQGKLGFSDVNVAFAQSVQES